MTMTDN